MSRMNVTDRFFAMAEKYPDRDAIIYRGQRISFARLAADVRATAALFQQKQIGKGHRVLVLVPMRIDLYRVLLALFHIGAQAVLIEEWMALKRVRACCRLADCHAMISTTKGWIISRFIRELRSIRTVLPLALKRYAGIEKKVETFANDTALISFTTGSTGHPKAADRTHGFLDAQFTALQEVIRAGPAERDMPAFPVVLLVNLGLGCTSAIPRFKITKPERMQPRKIIHQLQSQRVNRLECSPFFAERLADHLAETGTEIRGLAKIFVGGAPVFPALARKLIRAFPGAEITVIYGSTEAEPISTVSARDVVVQMPGNRNKGLRAGRPFRLTELAIIPIADAPVACTSDADFLKLRLPEEEIGEIVVAGPHVLGAYYNSREAWIRNKIVTDKTCWHRTGDSGYLHDGILYLTGRCNTLFRRRGETVAPFVFESAMSDLGFTAATLIEVHGRLVAVVEPRTGETPENLRARVRDAGFECDAVRVMKIPRDRRHHSKIDYGALRALLEKQ